MAKYPFEYEVFLKRYGSMEKEKKDTIEFMIEDRVVNATLILEKNSTSKDDDFSNVSVYKLDDFESDIPFEGTRICEIEKEFPDKKFSVEEILDKYVMFKDETLVIDGVH